MADNVLSSQSIFSKVSFPYTCGIYRIRNTRNGKCYIGQAKNFEVRRKEHIRTLDRKRKNSIFQNAWDAEKYKDVFVFEILIICQIGTLTIYEQILFDEFKPEYNATLIAGRIDFTPYVRQRIREGIANRSQEAKNLERERKSVALRGEGTHCCKITESIAIEIRKAEGTLAEIASNFSVSKSIIYEIKREKTWKHLTEPIKPFIFEKRNGEYSPNAKLTEKLVIKIRAEPGTAREIAEKYDVLEASVRGIKSGRDWKHITTTLIPITYVKSKKTEK